MALTIPELDATVNAFYSGARGEAVSSLDHNV